MQTPEDRIAEFAPGWVWNVRHCLATDPAVQYAIEQGDPANRTQLITVTLETTAAAYRVLAEGAAKAAQVVAGRTGA